MKKVLFLIHDLGPGGAEKVLVNLVNNLDREQFDITLLSIFDVGVNKKNLLPHIHYRYCFRKMFRGNSHIMKLLSPKQLHRLLIKDSYDIEVAYLEGPCARIVSGCENKNTKLFAWIHIEQHTEQRVAASFRSIDEATKCYNSFHRINCVSEAVKKDFEKCLKISVPIGVVYNTNESDKINEMAEQEISDIDFPSDYVTMIGVGKLLKSKGFDRLIKIVARLIEEKRNVRLLILGAGEESDNLRTIIRKYHLEDRVKLLGYQENPYKYISKCDLFVCASYQEGFSTAATEALIVGTPVCTVEVAGMKEMLGDNNEYGVVVPNEDSCLYDAIKELVTDRELLFRYKQLAQVRGRDFSLESTVNHVQNLFLR